MQVTGIKVMYRRVRRPADFEAAEAQIEFSAQAEAEVTGGEDYRAKAEEMLDNAKTLVLTKIGLMPVAGAPVAPGGTSTVVVANPAPAAPAAADGGKKTTGKGGSKAKDTPAPTPAPAAPVEALVPEGQRQISTGGERIDPAQAAAANNDDAFPSSAPAAAPAQAAPAAAKPYGVAELHGYVSDCIASKVVDGTFVRTKLAGFGVARMGDLKPEQVTSLKAELDVLVAKKKAGG